MAEWQQKEFAVITITENKKIYDGVQCGRWVLQKLNHRGARRYAQEKGGNQGESKSNKQPFKNTVTSTMFKIAIRGLHRQAKNEPLHKQKQWRSVWIDWQWHCGCCPSYLQVPRNCGKWRCTCPSSCWSNAPSITGSVVWTMGGADNGGGSGGIKPELVRSEDVPRNWRNSGN